MKWQKKLFPCMLILPCLWSNKIDSVSLVSCQSIQIKTNKGQGFTISMCRLKTVWTAPDLLLSDWYIYSCQATAQHLNLQMLLQGNILTLNTGLCTSKDTELGRESTRWCPGSSCYMCFILKGTQGDFFFFCGGTPNQCDVPPVTARLQGHGTSGSHIGG